MRRGIVVFIVINLVILLALVHTCWTLLSLLVVDGSADIIDPSELPKDFFWTLPVGEKSVIPKIIHQTYKNESIPAHWVGPRQSCIDLHPDYEHILWTDASARDMIADKYSWFLDTWDSYPYNIERADALRYFVLYTFGGVYIDLDDGCRRPLDPLLKYPAFLRRTRPTGISNDVMGSIPGHPFFLKTMNSLKEYNKSWFLPYITVMASTGPLFLSLIWRHYNTASPAPSGMDRVRILFPDEYMYTPGSFFEHNEGSSWHNNDLPIIMWLRDYWLLVTVVAIFLASVIFYFCYKCLNRASSSGTSSSWQTSMSRILPRWLVRSSDRLGSYQQVDRRGA